jgi:hypothetical protein
VVAGSKFQPCLELEVTSRIQAFSSFLCIATMYVILIRLLKVPLRPPIAILNHHRRGGECARRKEAMCVKCKMKKCICLSPRLCDPAITNYNVRASSLSFLLFIVSLSCPWYILSHSVFTFCNVKFQTGR